jgi:hypothetical protein
MDLPDQRIYLWFPKGKETMMLLDLISQFSTQGSADGMFEGLIDFEQGRPAAPVPVPSLAPPSPPHDVGYGPSAGSAPGGKP